MPQGAILEFYNSATMYLTHNICKNKANVTYHLYFLLHVKDEDVIVVLLYFTMLIRQSKNIFPQIFRILLCVIAFAFFLLLSV